MAVNALIFIGWDAYFTRIDVWGFNPEYLLGIYLFGLPLEEILFFVTVPYACVFIYETLNTYIKQDILQKAAPYISLILVIFLIPLALFFLPRLYTSVTFLFLSFMQGMHYLLFRNKVMGRFYMAYLVHLVPFLLVNGVLTAIPIVMYNDAYNTGVKIYTIPAEDTMYSMPMLLITITLYEYLKQNSLKQTAS